MNYHQGQRIPQGKIPSFMREQGLVYRETSREIYPGADTLDWSTGIYYRDNEEEFTRLTERYRKPLTAGITIPTELRWLGPEVGWGLFASQDLKRLSWVGEYAGVVDLAQDEGDLTLTDGHFHSDYAWNFPDELPDGRLLEINALKEGNELRYVNHSFTPNLSPDHTLWQGRWVTFFRTRRPIKAGEQLTIDYGEQYWSSEHRTLVIFEEPS